VPGLVPLPTLIVPGVKTATRLVVPPLALTNPPLVTVTIAEPPSIVPEPPT
jgi:hypothetical protein